MPVNVSGIHWALLAAHVPSKTISADDSLSMSAAVRYVDKWRYCYSERHSCERLGSGVGGDGGVMNEDDGCCGSLTGSAILGVVALSNPDDDDDDDVDVDGVTGIADGGLIAGGDIADDGGERLGSGVGGDGGVMNEDDGCCGSLTGSAILGVVAVSNPDADDDDDDNDDGEDGAHCGSNTCASGDGGADFPVGDDGEGTESDVVEDQSASAAIAVSAAVDNVADDGGARYAGDYDGGIGDGGDGHVKDGVISYMETDLDADDDDDDGGGVCPVFIDHPSRGHVVTGRRCMAVTMNRRKYIVCFPNVYLISA